MKTIIYFFITFLALQLNAQEQFFGNHSGFSAGYLHGFNKDNNKADAGAINFFHKNGLSLGIGYSNLKTYYGYEDIYHWKRDIEVKDIYMASVQYFINSSEESNYPNAVIGASYSYTDIYYALGFNFGLLKVLFKECNFPFSLDFNTAIKLIPDDILENFYVAIGIGYTQAFFAKNKIFPVGGMSISYNSFSKTAMYFLSAGLNIRL